MKKYNAGFIGAGNMGGALASALAAGGAKLIVFDTDTNKAEALCRGIGADRADSAKEACEADFVFLAVKPNVILGVAESLRGFLKPETVVVTMAAGVRLDEVAEAAGTGSVIRIMPNTPAAVGEGMILWCAGEAVGEAERAAFLTLMSGAGKLDLLSESLFDAAAGLSGCGPAYVYMFAEALADGAVACGVPREKAAFYAAQTILGSAKMLLESGKHPERLKDDVCSPGGTTIEGVLALEQNGFRYAAASAVKAAVEKTAKLKK